MVARVKEEVRGGMKIGGSYETAGLEGSLW